MPGTKWCPTCHEDKGVEQFSICRRKKDGLQWQCRSCQKIYRDGLDTPDRREKRQAYFRAYGLSRNYGMTVEDYELLFKKQAGLCAICGAEQPKAESRGGLQVDHNHSSGEIRGLLCVVCNMRLGILEDSEWMARAMRYLTGEC